jgi:hypothetical protein
MGEDPDRAGNAHRTRLSAAVRRGVPRRAGRNHDRWTPRRCPVRGIMAGGVPSYRAGLLERRLWPDRLRCGCRGRGRGRARGRGRSRRCKRRRWARWRSEPGRARTAGRADRLVEGNVVVPLTNPSIAGTLLAIAFATNIVTNLTLPNGWTMAAQTTVNDDCAAGVGYLANNPGGITSITAGQLARRAPCRARTP